MAACPPAERPIGDAVNTIHTIKNFAVSSLHDNASLSTYRQKTPAHTIMKINETNMIVVN